MDNNGEFEKLEFIKLPELWREVYQGRILTISKDRAEIYSLIELGEHKVSAVRVEKTEYVMRMPITTPIFHKAYRISLEDTIDADPGKDHRKGAPVGEDFQETALGMLERPMDPNERMTCENCKGKAFFVVNCSCTYGGVIFTDDESGEKTQLRENGVPDEDCENCHGDGKRMSDCPTCLGTAYNYKYPTLTLTNQETGQSATEFLEVARLIASGKLPLLKSEDGGVIIAKMSGLMRSMAEEVGINPKLLMGISEYGAYELDDARSEVYIHPNNTLRSRNRDKDEAPMTRRDIIDSIQLQLSRTFAHSWQSVLDEAGVPRGRNLRVFERPNANAQLKGLIEMVEANDWKLAYRRAFIETGVDGPGFVVLDNDMKLVAELSAEDNLTTAILNAYSVAKESLL
jgi:hypothetical protein